MKELRNKIYVQFKKPPINTFNNTITAAKLLSNYTFKLYIYLAYRFRVEGVDELLDFDELSELMESDRENWKRGFRALINNNYVKMIDDTHYTFTTGI